LKSTVKPKEKTKFGALIDAAGQRLGVFTQSFGLGVLQLFKENGSPLYGDVKRTTMIDKIIRLNGDLSDEYLYKNLKAILVDRYSVCK